MQPFLSKYLKRIDSFLQSSVIFVLTLLFYIIVLPFLIIIGLFFFLLRQIAIISAKLFKKGDLLSKPLSLQSSFMSNVDSSLSTSPFYTIVSAAVCQGIPDIGRIRDVIKRQILQKTDPITGKLCYPEMFQSISYHLGYPFWKKIKHADADWVLENCVNFYRNDGK
jgi:hypothetical protein